MGKNDYLTPKAIANRIKAKGLQKLRWYCQMCQKQCRDENGFKCHCMSEGHQRQMQIFGQNPDRILEGFSEEFEATFMDHLKHSHRSRVAATVVYNEYIADRHHVHMNSTKWLTLTEFVKHLGRTGKCKVEETPKGWFITYVDREGEGALREELRGRKARSEVVEEVRKERELLRQIERARSEIGAGRGEGVGERGESEEREKRKVGFVLGGKEKEKEKERRVVFEEEEEEEEKRGKKRRRGGGGSGGGRMPGIEETMKDDEKRKMKENRKDYWLCEGIVVKVLSKVGGGVFYKKKGVVRKVIDKYVGEIEMIEGGKKVRVDQEELETVIPQIGGLVRIVNGAYCGNKARLIAVNEEDFNAKLQIEKGLYDGRVLPDVNYEDFCKLA